MWTIFEAQKIISEVKDKCFELGWAPALTGSVLYKGCSTNDLDIVFYPLKSNKPPYKAVVELLTSHLQAPIVLVADHTPKGDSKLVVILYLADNRSVDLFFPTLTHADREDTLATCGKKFYQ